MHLHLIPDHHSIPFVLDREYSCVKPGCFKRSADLLSLPKRLIQYHDQVYPTDNPSRRTGWERACGVCPLLLVDESITDRSRGSRIPRLRDDHLQVRVEAVRVGQFHSSGSIEKQPPHRWLFYHAEAPE